MSTSSRSNQSLTQPDLIFKNESLDTKSHILKVGYQLIAQQGFTAVGLKQILDTAGIPKGSFYHYFESKEAFGKEVINGYFNDYKTKLDNISKQQMNAQQKLYTYFQYWYDTQQAVQKDTYDHEKCLMVKLSAEVSDISDPMRIALEEGYKQTTCWISEQINVGWAEGSIPVMSNVAAQALANRWYYTWLGASLIAKTSQSNMPLAEVWQMTTAELGC